MSEHKFTSDLHFGHRKVAEIRGFTTTALHDFTVFNSLLDNLHKNDILWILGDVVGIGSDLHYSLDLLSRLPCRLRLVSGNHDPSHPMHRPSVETMDSYYETFEYVEMAGEVKIGGQRFMLSHFPYRIDRGEPRHVEWRLPDVGRDLLHGHTHDQRRYTSNRELHVGWDAWHRPVTSGEVLDFCREEN